MALMPPPGLTQCVFDNFIRIEPNLNIAYRFAQMAVDGLFGYEVPNETPMTSKEKSKKRAAPGSKVRRIYFLMSLLFFYF